MSFADEPKLRTALREPFPPEQISKLPRTEKRPALDYVGHAAVTDRLNHASPDWSYTVEPITVEGNDGWPHVIGVFGSMTVGGVTRQEVGAVDSPSSYGQEMKEAISDFIRRGAMRFGVAIDLWSKEDLSKAERATKDSGGPSNPDEGKAQAATGTSGTVRPPETTVEAGDSRSHPDEDVESAAPSGVKTASTSTTPSAEPEAVGERAASPSAVEGEEGVGEPLAPSSPKRSIEGIHVHSWATSWTDAKGAKHSTRDGWVVCTDLKCGASIEASKVNA